MLWTFHYLLVHICVCFYIFTCTFYICFISPCTMSTKCSTFFLVITLYKSSIACVLWIIQTIHGNFVQNFVRNFEADWLEYKFKLESDVHRLAVVCSRIPYIFKYQMSFIIVPCTASYHNDEAAMTFFCTKLPWGTWHCNSSMPCYNSLPLAVCRKITINLIHIALLV